LASLRQSIRARHPAAVLRQLQSMPFSVLLGTAMFWTRTLVIAACLTFLAVLGSVLFAEDAPGQAPSPDRPGPIAGAGVHGVEGLPFIGAGMQIQRVDWIDRYRQSIDEIAAVGGDTVLLVVDARQENGSSSRIYLDMRMTPTPDQLSALIRHAKSRNLR